MKVPSSSSTRFLALSVVLAGLVFHPGAALGQGPGIRLGVLDPSSRIFTVAGPAGDRYVLEYSTNLVHWSGAETNYLFGYEAPGTFFEPALPGRTFYRARRYEPPLTCNCFETAPPGSGCPVYGPPDQPIVRNAAIPTAATPIKTLRLMLHVLAENDGRFPAVNAGDLQEQIDTLNSHFFPHRIRFVADSRIVPHTGFRHPASDADLLNLRRTYSASPDRQLNVFITAMPGENYGTSTSPWDPAALTADGGIVITLLRCRGNEALLTHEIGHALGLWHTHHGSDESELTRCHDCWERADSSGTPDADITGDRCSDTPPGRLTDVCGPAGGIDPCSATNWPIAGLNNFMSAFPLCSGRFTPQQAGRMHAWIDYRLTSWLDNITPVPPSGLAAVANSFGEVFLTWVDNSWNETSFSIERALGEEAFVAIATVPANVTAFTDATAPPEFPCRYRVRAFNGLTPSGYSAPVAVSTGPAPLVLHVDARNTTPPFLGTPTDPYRVLEDGFTAARPGTVLRIHSGNYRTVFPANPPPMRLEPLGGTVIIQKP